MKSDKFVLFFFFAFRIVYRVTETSGFTLSGPDEESGTFSPGSHATDVYTLTDG